MSQLSGHEKWLSFVRWAGLLVLLFLLLGQCLYFAWDNGQTIDETYYNGTGYLIVRYNHYGALGEHPPLMMQLGSLPLLFLQPNFPINNLVFLGDSKEIDISKTGSKFLYEMGNDAHLILFLERVPIALVTVLLGVTLWLWSKELFGWAGALISLLLLTFTPDIIANGGQFTTDMGVTTFFFLTVYRTKKFFESSSVRNAVLIGICAGLAFLSKMSSSILVPVIFILFTLSVLLKGELESGFPQSPQHKLNLSLFILGACLFLLALGERLLLVAIGSLDLLVLGVIIREYTRGNSKVRQRFWPFVQLLYLAAAALLAVVIAIDAHKRPPLLVWGAAIWIICTIGISMILTRNQASDKERYLAKTYVLIWFVSALVVFFGYTDFYRTVLDLDSFEHFMQVFKASLHHAGKVHTACVSGSPISCDWRYFFEVMLVKTPLFAMLLVFVGVFATWRQKISTMNKLILFIPPLVFWLFASFVNRIFIGIRHIIPLYPFLYLIAGSVAPTISNLKLHFVRRALWSFLFLGLGYTAYRGFLATPHNFSYFNELVKDSQDGARFVPVNAGQDNKRLAEAVQRLNIPFIKIGSTANNPPEYNYYGLRWSLMEDRDFVNPSEGYYALDLYTYVAQQSDEQSWFRNRDPDYRAGKTFFIFKVAS